jgi:hypothetical protein
MLAHRIAVILMLAVAAGTTVVIGADDSRSGEIKEFTGISITGDKEAPKSLYIVPWQDSDHKQNTTLSSDLADSSMQAVDRESFRQQLRLYELGKTGWHKITAESP